MEKKTSYDAVVAVVAKQLNKKPADIKPTDRIAEDLGADSLDVIDMLMNLEESHGVIIPDEAAQNLKTVADVVAHLDGVSG